MKITIRLLSILLIVPFVFSCSKNDIEPAGSGESGLVFNVDKSKMLQLVNEVRASGCTCGATKMPPVPPLVWNDLLAKAAFGHSEDMAQKNYFNHTGSNGSNAGQRITAEGYRWTAYGENIARGPLSEADVMRGWLSSEGHCMNIMSPNFRDMGAGRAGSYWTQAFGAR